jgi:hypothetical protein
MSNSCTITRADFRALPVLLDADGNCKSCRNAFDMHAEPVPQAAGKFPISYYSLTECMHVYCRYIGVSLLFL